jgi:hypothetical protein
MERFIKTGTIILPAVFIACTIGNTVIRFGSNNFILVIISSLMIGFMLTMVAGIFLIQIWVVISFIQTLKNHFQLSKSNARRPSYDD